MKKIFLLFIIIMPLISCNLFKPTIGAARFIKEAGKLFKTDNPALEKLIKQELTKSMLEIKGIEVFNVVQYPTNYYLWKQWESINFIILTKSVKYQFCIYLFI